MSWEAKAIRKFSTLACVLSVCSEQLQLLIQPVTSNGVLPIYISTFEPVLSFSFRLLRETPQGNLIFPLQVFFGWFISSKEEAGHPARLVTQASITLGHTWQHMNMMGSAVCLYQAGIVVDSFGGLATSAGFELAQTSPEFIIFSINDQNQVQCGAIRNYSWSKPLKSWGWPLKQVPEGRAY